MASTLSSTWINSLRTFFTRFRSRSERLPFIQPQPLFPRVDAGTMEPHRPAEFWMVDPSFVLNPHQGLCYRIAIDIFFNARHYVVIDSRAGPEHSHSYRLEVKGSSQVLALNDQVVVGYSQLRDRMKQVVNAYNN